MSKDEKNRGIIDEYKLMKRWFFIKSLYFTTPKSVYLQQLK
jgi:hypothetical protein